MHMQTITLVTGNPHKLAELKAIFPETLNLVSENINLDEIQSLELHDIVAYKLQQAYKVIQAPVIVEDVSTELAKLNGLPGPFIKYFEQRLGRGALYTLAGEGRVKIVCAMGYYDGDAMRIVDGVMEGRIVEPRGGEGFGFDFVLIPDGYENTISELGAAVKNTISHRSKAARAMAEYLKHK